MIARVKPALQIRCTPKPGRVNGLMATAQQNHILVKWDKNPEPDIKSYTLYRSKNDGRFSKITVMDPEKTRYADDDLKPEVTYRYRIIAEDQDRLKSDSVESDSIHSPIIQPEG
jgi:fibronectin type 3 domain-containing protein